MQRSSLLLLEIQVTVSEIDKDYIEALAGTSAWKIVEPHKKSKTHPRQDNRSREGVGGKK